MIIRQLTALCLLTSGLFLAACAAPAFNAMNRPDDVVPLRLIVQGKPANNLHAEHGRLNSVVAQLRAGGGGQCAPGLTGPAGIFAFAFLKAADMALGGSAATVDFSGQITHYEYNPVDGSGRLHVTTFAAITTGGVTRTDAYKWEVAVLPGGFTVIPHSGNPTDPFPGTLQFSPEMLNRISANQLMFKLWANGPEIVVERVDFDDDYDPSNPTFVYLDPAQPQFHKYRCLYETTNASCIDMMFQASPPTDMSGLSAPPFYCLGRCAQPFIINTR